MRTRTPVCTHSRRPRCTGEETVRMHRAPLNTSLLSEAGEPAQECGLSDGKRLLTGQFMIMSQGWFMQ
jgi:hypothetical protein